MTAAYTTDDAQLASASTLVGQTLYEYGGDKLGAIKELFINKLTGQVEFVLGASGGFLGVGEKFHPLPWTLLSYSQAPEGYVVSVSKEAIRAAPAYDREQLNSASYGWGDQVRRYFTSLKG